MVTDQQGLVLMDIQLGHVVYHEARQDMRVWRGAGGTAAFERDTQEVTLELVGKGLAVLPDDPDVDCTIRVSEAGAAALEEWRDAVRLRRR